MKYTYKFQNEAVEIEVGAEWVSVLMKEDRVEYNNDRANTRRHCSLESYNLDNALIPSDADVEQEALDHLEGTEQEQRCRRLHSAIDKLSPEQQDLTMKVLLGGMKKSDYAAANGISPAAVTKRIAAIYRIIRKIFRDR